MPAPNTTCQKQPEGDLVPTFWRRQRRFVKWTLGSNNSSDTVEQCFILQVLMALYARQSPHQSALRGHKLRGCCKASGAVVPTLRPSSQTVQRRTGAAG
eukprot:351121-Chlamydomonas_euryale.AAC.10